MRTIIDHPPYGDANALASWDKRGRWPCAWIALPDLGTPPFVVAYRCRFAIQAATTIRVHVTADERYDLFLDGVRIGRGSERGDTDHWFFETYDIRLEPGPHVLVARVWSLGEGAPFAQMSAQHGFLLSPDATDFVSILGTGVAEWHGHRLGGYTFENPTAAWGTGQNLTVSGDTFDWEFEQGHGEGWSEVVVVEPGVTAPHFSDLLPFHFLTPATLPAMLDSPRQPGTVYLVTAIPSMETHALPLRQADNLAHERQEWHRLWSGAGSVTVPPNTRRRILIDLEDYYCAYPDLVVSGGTGSRVRIHWQETLFNEPDSKTKGNRDQIEGKYFVTIWWNTDGIGDTFLPDGGALRHFETLWWQCVRFVEIVVETLAEPLVIEHLQVRETRYPMERENAFESSVPQLAQVIPLATRTLQVCSHETYMDCPYYEQLMYIGDTRLQALTTFVCTVDDRLPRKALTLFNWSRMNNGITQSRYPTRVRQIIPPFALWWVAMVHDYALWRGDLAFVASLVPGVRVVLDAYRTWMGSDGLVQAPQGWNYMDWAPEWDGGIPPGGHSGVSAVLNLHFAHVLRLAGEIETWLSEPEMAVRHNRTADTIMSAVVSQLWDEDRGLFADDHTFTRYSEHAQCLALLEGTLPESVRDRVGQSLLAADDLVRTTIYFTHYLFEAYYLLGCADQLLARMDLWFELKQQGLKTTVEMPEPTRSDCHAWGAHPLYHYFASLLGIRPLEPGFRKVRVAPQPGPVSRLRGMLPHPAGEISVWLQQETNGLSGDITLPEGVTGIFEFAGHRFALGPGRQVIHAPNGSMP